jgi:glycerophosphoryl diester phosphodiesterase
MADVPLLLGHRGARGLESAPENTIAAFDLALAEGCAGFEFDVRLSGDAQAVICHDPIVRNQEANNQEVANISANTLALMLRDVLQRYQSRAFLDIELKVPGLEKLTTDLLAVYPPTRGYVVSSFSPEVLHELHRTDTTIPLGLICETSGQLAQWRNLPIRYVIPQHDLIDQESIGQLRKAGCKVLVWTLNSATDIERFAAWGVDGIISDNPAALVRILRSDPGAES